MKNFIFKTSFLIIILFSLWSLISYSLNFKTDYAFYGAPKMPLPFGDLASATYSSSCNLDIESLRDENLNCDPFKRPFNYPKLLIDILRFMNLGIDQTGPLGLSLGLIFIITIIFLYKINIHSLNSFGFSSLVILSYPSQLVMERGNYDSLIFVIFTFLIISLNYGSNKNNFLMKLPSLFLVCISICLKIFPLAGIFLWSTYNSVYKFKKKFFTIEVAIMIASLISTLFTFWQNDISKILNNTPRTVGTSSFGINNNYQYFVLWKFFLVLKLILIIYTIISVTQSLRKFDILIDSKLSAKNFSFQLWLLCSLQIISLYFLFSSWDYRLIFTFGMIPFLIKIWGSLPDKFGIFKKEYFLVFFIFVIYHQYIPETNIPEINIFGDLAKIFSDIILQPILIGFTTGLIFDTITKRRKSLIIKAQNS